MKTLLFALGLALAFAQRRATAYFADLMPTQADIDAEIERARRVWEDR
jgi:hypothetical protein